MRKKFFILFLVVFVFGSLAGSVFFAGIRQSRASIFDSFLDLLKRGAPAIPVPSSTESAPQTKESPLYGPGIDYEEAVIEAVEKSSPSVVSIVISKDLPIIENCPYDPFGNLPPEFHDLFGDSFGGPRFERPCEKGSEKREIGGGSGFVISSDGMIITNKHVVRDASAEYTVLTNNGEKYKAEILARDPAQDLAIIKINALGLKPATIGDSDSVKLGQTAIAIGNALGEFRNTVSVGVVSGLSRNITASGAGFSEQIEGLIQTDAAINQGNSGGPLLNLKGEVIGVNTAVASGAQNVGFAIPINEAKRDISSVKATGKIQTPFLGVRYRMITPELAKEQSLPIQYGALVRGNDDGPGVMSGSPADKAGVMAEDIILELNGKKIESGSSLASLIGRYEAGEEVILKIRRGEKAFNLKVKLGERPEGT